METFGQQFKKWRQQKGVSGWHIEKVTERLGQKFPRSNLSNLESGRYVPSPEALKVLSQVPELEITYDQLMLWRAFHGFQGTKPLELIKAEGFYRIPCKGQVAAGKLERVTDVEDIVYYEWVDIKEYSPDLFCLRVCGDSMEPKIPNGAILLCRPAKGFVNNRIYVIQTSTEESTIKLVRFSQEGLQLIPLNNNHPSIPVQDFDIQELFEVLEYKVSLL